MFNQFHDIICGCSVPQVYEDAAAAYGYAQQIANEQANRALQQITWSIDTLGSDSLPCSKDEDWRLWGYGDKGTPLVIYNPLPFEMEVPVEAARLHKEITDSEGNPLLTQQVRNAVTSADEGWDHQELRLHSPGACHSTWTAEGSCHGR
jgi:alpha-mannosidase